MKTILEELDWIETYWMVRDYNIKTRKRFRQQLFKERVKKTLRVKDTVYSSPVMLAIAMLDRPSCVQLEREVPAMWKNGS